jgi:hypothetical protein
VVVKFVAPGVNTLQQVLEAHPDFDQKHHYFYNGFTVCILHASKKTAAQGLAQHVVGTLWVA